MPGLSYILIVQESETQAAYLRRLLEQQGWEVQRASTSEEALDEMKRQLPALVIVDDHSHGTLADFRPVPILMLVQDSQSETPELDRGADVYVSKSDSAETLLARIRSLLHVADQPSRDAESLPGEFRPARLLAIDDSPTYLEYLALSLTLEGYEVVKALDGEKGLERLRNESFDCVIVDLLMPEMDGIEVCRRISEMERRQLVDHSMAIIMLTARETRDDMTRGLEAGADDFVGKSTDMAVLKARIRALLRRKFFQEENRRILEELKNKELEAVRARAAREAAEVRASLAEALAQTNSELQETNRRLKETQAHLVQSEKMASLGQLVAGVAHEINNPLAFVINNTFLIQEGLDRVASDEQDVSLETRRRLDRIKAQISEIQEGTDRVKDLVTKLRTFSRLDEGTFKTVNVHESIESVLLFLRHKTDGRIQVEKKFSAPDNLSCFAGELNQVLMNVIANAIDAVEDAGKIVLTTRKENEDFIVTVRDTGKGIPEEIRNRVFEPFFTTKPVGHGTGLGLAISYGIIKAHKGSIEFSSKDGEGTEFVIKIPTTLNGDV